jgi:hypothetical protein
MAERSSLIAAVRAEIIGPERWLTPPTEARFVDGTYLDPDNGRRGSLAWRPEPDGELEEILFFDRESPHRKYGGGQLHPILNGASVAPSEVAAQSTDTLGVDLSDTEDSEPSTDSGEGGYADLVTDEVEDEFEVTSPDVRHPSTIGVSCCVRIGSGGGVRVRLPQSARYSWQASDETAFPVNGRYETCKRQSIDEQGNVREGPMWRRRSAVGSDCVVEFTREELNHRRAVRKPVPLHDSSPLRLSVEVYPRLLDAGAEALLLTIVLRNDTKHQEDRAGRNTVLYQTYFDISVFGGKLEKYPDSGRPFEQLDDDEQSLALLYREAATWGIGHGCAAGWDAEGSEQPSRIYADVLPAVETPSMTPAILDTAGVPIELSMRELASLPNDGSGAGWDRLTGLADSYESWIRSRRLECATIPESMRTVGSRHLERCDASLARIRTGITLLREDDGVRLAFKLANLAMLLQQIATKQLKKRELVWDAAIKRVRPDGQSGSAWSLYASTQETQRTGHWRAFQVAFLLSQLEGISDSKSPDSRVVDLIWFPTGGGKTEAYLGVMAYYMFHQRLLMTPEGSGPLRDGTNVLMRYTLRMLTTQQFQRAASLICAMEFLRRRPELHNLGVIPGRRFSLALWIGGESTPNKIKEASSRVRAFQSGTAHGNPLVLTECPWCRTPIGRPEVPDASGAKSKKKSPGLLGIDDNPSEGPRLFCPDPKCEFGQEAPERWLPIEVIDERIYRHSPSLVIATADKFAMLAYRPAAGALFGRKLGNAGAVQQYFPPGLIVQDELHLIAGPLGTMYGLYEGVVEQLCTYSEGDALIVPKIIASTATIRGAADQTKSLYARVSPSGGALVQLFPSPGLSMGDSFFGVYARTSEGQLKPGRLYLGIHANDYGSVLTSQVRVFAAAICHVSNMPIEVRDAWWSLLVFYNSLRELGGAKTLFDSDIRSRVKFLLNREGVPADRRRHLHIVEELTSRLSQTEIVGMLDRLSTPYSSADNRALDACLASSIIEVGVDVDRLSLMGVVGQPKTTAQYIQVTGRVGRRWEERPGLILMIYSPSKSRDRSHYEQFHSYHRRLYERVEPTSATPFAPSAIQRGLAGALLIWARQQSTADVSQLHEYRDAVIVACELLKQRCRDVQVQGDIARSIDEMDLVCKALLAKWSNNPQLWEEFPPAATGEYLMLWPGQFATKLQKERAVVVPSSMRQVDGSAELAITQAYAIGSSSLD